MLFTDIKFNYFAKDPAVVNYGGKYYLYYTFKYPEQNKFGIGIAYSTDMENWVQADYFPETQMCETNGICAPAAIVIDDVIHMFYQTYGNGADDAICHAMSMDGINFIKDETNPVYHPPKTWCCGRAIDADVCVFNNKLYLYFATRDHKLEVQKIGVASASLNSKLSRSDFKEEHSSSVIAPEYRWEQKCIEAPATIVHNNKIYMFYAGAYNCSPQQIGCAVSNDGILFERLFDKPFITNGEKGTWNENESGHPYVFEDVDGRIHLFYQGTKDMGKTWYLSRVEIAFDEKGVPYIIN